LYAKKEHKNLKGYGAENGVQNVFFGGVFTSMDKEGTVNVAFLQNGRLAAELFVFLF